MSWAEDEGHDTDYGHDFDKDVVCRFCGRDYGLEWVELSPDVWRLYDEDGELHDCRKAKAAEDDFEDLSEEPCKS